MLASLSLASLALVGSVQSTQEADHAGLLATMPRDAVFALVIEDFEALWSQAGRSDWAKLAADPSSQPLWDWFDALLQHELKRDDVIWSRGLDALHGVAFFAGLFEQNDLDARGLALRLRPGFADVEAAMRAEIARRGEPVEFEGRSFFAGRGGYSRSSEVFFAWSEGFAVIDARERENAHQLAATWAQALESGSSTGGLADRLPLARPTDPTALEVYLDLGSLIASTLNPQGTNDRRTFDAFGLNDFGWGGLSLSIGEGSEVDVVASLELPRHGPWPLLAGHAGPTSIRRADLAPANAIEVAALGFDAKGAWRGVVEWLAEELPDVSDELAQGLASINDSTGIDFEEELVGQLTGEFTRFLLPLDEDERASLNGFVASVMIGLIGSPGSAAGNVYLIGIEDAGAVEGLIDKLIALSDEPERVEEQQVSGGTLCSYVVPELRLNPSWGLADGAFVFSLYPSGVRAVLTQASEDPPPAWIDADRRAALLSGGTAIGASVGDLEQLTQVQVVAPLARLAEVFRQSPGRPPGGDNEKLSVEFLGEVADALPSLVEKYVSGTARTTLAIEGRVLRYRFWTD